MRTSRHPADSALQLSKAGGYRSWGPGSAAIERDIEDTTMKPETDLARAEVIESAGIQNSLVAAGPQALIMIPLAWVLTQIGRMVRRLRNQ